MKSIFKILIITGLIISATSCSDWLDLRPESEIVLDDYWLTESHVNQVLSACYRSLTEPGSMSRMLVWGELRSDNVTYGIGMPTSMYKIVNVDISPDNEYCHWGSLYTVINYCNNFLYYAPGVVDKDPNFTESKLRAMEAEVLTIRALSYFYLVRTFNEVPWVEDPSIDDAQNYTIPKSPEDSILTHLVDDLKTALIYARDNFEVDTYNKGRVTRNAVRALLADIYLWVEDYDNCIYYCDQILNDTEQDLQLVPGEDVIPEVFYTGNSSESIFELQYDDDIMFNWTTRNFYGYDGYEVGEWSFPAVLVTGNASPFKYQAGALKESEEDLREKDFLNNPPGSEKYFVFKYAGVVRQEDEVNGVSDYIYRSNSANWIVYRLSEIMLMKAEALIQLESNPSEALSLINTTYLRSNTELIDGDLQIENYNTKLDLEKLLLRERQRELMFEGKRWFDLMRLARRADEPSALLNYVTKKFTGTASIQATKMSVMDALYLPIHTDELKANTALEQNEFYELISDGLYD